MVLTEPAALLELEARPPGGLSPPLCRGTERDLGWVGLGQLPGSKTEPGGGAMSSSGPGQRLVTQPHPSPTDHVWFVRPTVTQTVSSLHLLGHQRLGDPNPSLHWLYRHPEHRARSSRSAWSHGTWPLVLLCYTCLRRRESGFGSHLPEVPCSDRKVPPDPGPCLFQP